MSPLRPIALIVSVMLAALHVAAQTAEKPADAKEANPPKTREEAFERAGVKLVKGPATVQLGKVAEVKLPEGYSFVGPESLDRFYQLTENMRGGDEVGVVMAEKYMLFFSYKDVGYIKDADKETLDADKLMKAMTENEEASNEARKERGWEQIKMKGWATQPHYDAKTNNLKWAINLTSQSDGFKDVFINESIRLLGRGGVMNVTLVTDQAGFAAAEASADKLLAANFSYLAGEKYAEWKQGDKVAAYGLSALVLGGAGVAAAKLGLFAKLGVLLGKFWKAIVFGVIALVVGLKKLLGRVTGARPPEQPPAA